MAKKKVLVLQGLHPEGMRLFAKRGDIEAVVLDTTDENRVIEAARDAQAITVRTVRVTRAVIEAAKDLKVVSRHGVGYDTVDVAALSERGIPLTIAIHSNMVSVAEHVMYMLLALAKMGAHHDAMTRSGDWSARLNAKAWDLAGKNLLVVGFGRTGSRVAHRALAFDMSVHVYDPYIDHDLIRQADCIPVADFRAALPQMDAVSINCPLNAETRNLFSSTEFAHMQPSAVIVNCARGGIIDERALQAALIGGTIRGAGLDVFAVEPSPEENPLFALDNVILSPHIAGVTAESMIRMSRQTAQNVLDLFDDRLDPDVVVNREVLKQ